MAKKAQQLQADINSDEELYKFIERPGLIVLDIYSEWCGPCLAMVNSLRKIKLEIGGDNLSLAICKADTIEAFVRFRNKSEPTWMFVTRGKAVNLMFGSEVPKLTELITRELSLLQSSRRNYYELYELQPEERARRDLIENALAEARRKEIEEAERERLDYLNHVTNEIMANLPDNGVTIFGPQVTRDHYKKIFELGEHHKLQVKDRRTMVLNEEQFQIVNYACENPLEPEVLEQMYGKDLLVCFWKYSGSEAKPLEEIFLQFINELTALTKPRDEDSDEPPGLFLEPLEIRIYPQVEAEEEIEEPDEQELIEDFDDPLANLMAVPEVVVEEHGGEEEAEVGGEEASIVGEEKGDDVSIVPSDVEIIWIPPVWVPKDRRTHATLIYVFFRPQTTQFLPPDPVPDPPHIIMAFDAYKKKDIFETIAKNRENILFYGFFTNDNPQTAKLIASTLTQYEKEPHQISDKIILKVAKKTSHTMLAFANYGPTYISANTVVGKEEAELFFPADFTNEEKTEPEVEQKPTKKSKGKDKDKDKEKEKEKTEATEEHAAE